MIILMYANITFYQSYLIFCVKIQADLSIKQYSGNFSKKYILLLFIWVYDWAEKHYCLILMLCKYCFV